MALAQKAAGARLATAAKPAVVARVGLRRPLVVRASAQADKVGAGERSAVAWGLRGRAWSRPARLRSLPARPGPAPPGPPIGARPQAKTATVAAAASVLALAVPQAAQAAQEAFMMAEVRATAAQGRRGRPN